MRPSHRRLRQWMTRCLRVDDGPPLHVQAPSQIRNRGTPTMLTLPLRNLPVWASEGPVSFCQNPPRPMLRGRRRKNRRLGKRTWPTLQQSWRRHLRHRNFLSTRAQRPARRVRARLPAFLPDRLGSTPRPLLETNHHRYHTLNLPVHAKCSPFSPSLSLGVVQEEAQRHLSAVNSVEQALRQQAFRIPAVA